MKSMTIRTAATIAHINSLQLSDYERDEILMIILNAVEEYIPRNIVEVYEDLIWL